MLVVWLMKDDFGSKINPHITQCLVWREKCHQGGGNQGCKSEGHCVAFINTQIKIIVLTPSHYIHIFNLFKHF